MDCFDILGLSSSSDKKAIKHAYAKLLKKYNPEDDPEGYQKLREAYDNALKYVKSHKAQNDISYDNYQSEENTPLNHSDNSRDYNEKINRDNTENYDNTFTTDFDIHNNIDDYLNNTEESYNSNNIESYRPHINDEDLYKTEDKYDHTEEDIDIFTNKLNELYSNLRFRTSTEKWKELLNDDLLWNLETSVKVKGIIISFICSHRFIPKDVMNQIDDILKINGNEISNSYTYTHEDIDNYIDIYLYADTLSYDYMYDINPVYEDKYIELRMRIKSMMNNSSHNFLFSEIKNYFDTAVNLYDKDPEIYMLMADYYLEIGYTDNALYMYKKVFSIDSCFKTANIKAGEILFYRHDYIHALEYLETYCFLHKDDIKALYITAHCYYYTKQYNESLNYFNIIRSSFRGNRYVNKYIKNISRKINGKFAATIKFNRNLFDSISTFNEPKKKNTTKDYRKITIAIIIIMFALSIAKTSIYNNGNRNTNKTSSKTYTADGYKTLHTLNDLKLASVNTKIAITLSDVEVMDCYKLVSYTNATPSVKVTRFMKKQDMIDDDYWSHAHGRIYSGTIEGRRIFFECSKDLSMEFDKNKRYIIKGYVSTLNDDMFKSLSSFVKKPEDYLSSKYISTSPILNLPTNTKNDLSSYKEKMDKLNKELNEKSKDHRN